MWIYFKLKVRTALQVVAVHILTSDVRLRIQCVKLYVLKFSHSYNAGYPMISMKHCFIKDKSVTSLTYKFSHKINIYLLLRLQTHLFLEK